MSIKNLALDVESIALALSEEGGYEYYRIDDDLKELAKNIRDIQAENTKLRKLATDALKHIVEVECEAPNRERFRGKPCEDCTEYGSSDCPKIMARMYGELEIEVD